MVQADLAARIKCWEQRDPKRTDWAEDSIDETLTYYQLRRQHHKYVKITTCSNA